MGLFDGKKGLILGVANDRSIAWSIATQIMSEGGDCGFTHLPDKPDDDRKKNHRRVAKCLDGHARAKFLVPLNVQDDDNIAAVMKTTAETFGKIDFLLHSIAFASIEDLRNDTIRTSRDGFKLAMEISAFSLLAIANAAQEVLNDGASILTLTYYGGEKIVSGYNVMGICKAALDASMRYLAYDLGPRNIKVNALSAGPVKTLAASAVGHANEMESLYKNMSPLNRNITPEEVGRTGAFLLSDMSNGITAEIVHVDAGYNAMGSPGRLLDKISG